LKMRIISMGTKDGSVFTDVPNFNDPEIPSKIGEWNRRWGKKPGEGSGNAGIKIVIENKSESEDKEYIARIISGHPVWIQSE